MEPLHHEAEPTFQLSTRQLTAHSHAIRFDGGQVLELAGELCSAALADLAATLVDWYERTTADPTIVDLGDIEFIDARGLALLAEIHRRAAEAGRSLLVGRVSACAAEMFDLCELHHLVDLTLEPYLRRRRDDLAPYLVRRPDDMAPPRPPRVAHDGPGLPVVAWLDTPSDDRLDAPAPG